MTKTKIEDWQFSSKRMTVWIRTESKIGHEPVIIDGAPIIRKFMGQSIYNLHNWMKKQGELQVYSLKEQ